MRLTRIFRPLVMLSAAAAAPGAIGADPQVDVKTSAGTIRLELYPAKAPRTVDNFLQYAKDGHFNGTIFHRVIDGFMIQGGGFDKAMNQKQTRPPIENEARNGLRNDLGTIAMARTSAPHSASAQWFINVKSNDFLNADRAQDGWGYAVFGKVVSGMDVVMKISRVPTGNSGMHQNVPREPIVIESVTVVTDKK
jgi:cyclophilin family peptidyl-prolyl cis-trans isomerase